MAFSSLTLNSNYSKYWCGIFPSFPDVLKFFLHHLPMDPLGLLDSIDTSFDIRCHTNIIPEDCSMILSKYSLKILNINIRSMQKNFDNFLVTKSRLHVDYDVIVLGECWLNESSNIRHIQGYVSFHSCNYINKSGGVTIYVRDKWCPTFMELNVEDSNCVLAQVPDQFTVIAIYRSPSYNPETFIRSLDLNLKSVSHTACLVLAGDININIHGAAADSNSSSEYLGVLAEHGLIPSIVEPTHGKSCIDHIFVPARCNAEAVVCSSDLTDHDITMVGIALKTKKSKRIRTRRSKTIIDFESIRLDLEKNDWTSVLTSASLDEAVSNFTQTVTGSVDKHSKTVIISRSKTILNPWMTPGLIRCSKQRDKLHAALRKDPDNPIKKLTYTRYRNFYISLIRKVKSDYNNREVTENKSNPKKLWKTIKNITDGERCPTSNQVLLTTKSSPAESLDYCNSYFATIGNKLASDILQKSKETQHSLASKVNISDPPIASFYLSPTDPGEVLSLMRSLDSDSAPGKDGISNKLIKSISNAIADPLAAIFNLSLSSGAFPSEWKVSVVIPIHKGENKEEPCNYRPISLLGGFSKLLERIVNKRLIRYLEDNCAFSNHQFGFRQGKSTEEAVTLLVDTVVSHLDQGRCCIGVFLDLAKAFDTVSIPILLSKLSAYGIRGLSLDWFSSYLSGRGQCVKVGDHLSDVRPVNFGVPQGSILGPTLFITYINDIMRNVMQNSETICYADDTAILFHGRSWDEVNRLATLGMKRIQNWLNQNILTLNSTKTQFLCFHKTAASRPPESLLASIKVHNITCVASAPNQRDVPSCNCSSIRRTDSLKYLGVTIDQNLNFKKHVSVTSARVRKLMYVMKTLRESTDGSVTKLVYLALCESIINYCILAWGGAASSTILVLERAQRAVLKVGLGRRRLHPTVEVYKEAQVLSVRRLFLIRAAVYMHKQFLHLPSRDSILRKRVFKLPTIEIKSSFAQRFKPFLLPRIYNTLANITNIQYCKTHEAKKRLLSLLLSWNYKQSEEILKVYS